MREPNVEIAARHGNSGAYHILRDCEITDESEDGDLASDT